MFLSPKLAHQDGLRPFEPWAKINPSFLKLLLARCSIPLLRKKLIKLACKNHGSLYYDKAGSLKPGHSKSRCKTQKPLTESLCTHILNPEHFISAEPTGWIWFIYAFSSTCLVTIAPFSRSETSWDTLFYFFMYLGILLAGMSVHPMHARCLQRPEGSIRYPRLELQTFVNCHVGAGTQTTVLKRVVSALKC